MSSTYKLLVKGVELGSIDTMLFLLYQLYQPKETNSFI